MRAHSFHSQLKQAASPRGYRVLVRWDRAPCFQMIVVVRFLSVLLALSEDMRKVQGLIKCAHGVAPVTLPSCFSSQARRPELSRATTRGQEEGLAAHSRLPPQSPGPASQPLQGILKWSLYYANKKTKLPQCKQEKCLVKLLIIIFLLTK